MKIRHVIVAALTATLAAGSVALPTLAYAEGESAADQAVSVQAATGALQVNVHDATINASQLKGNLMQLKWQLKDLMLDSATRDGADVSGMIEAAFNHCNPSDLTSKKPGKYTISFFYGGSDEVATATLTVTDSSAAAAPKLTSETVSATKGGVLLTVMGQGVTNEPHALPAGSYSVGDATERDGAWYADATINPSSIDAYYKPLVPAVAQDKASYDMSASSLTATFKWDADAQKWVVETPAKVTFNVVLAKDGVFDFADSATVTPADVKSLGADKLIALIKEKLVKKAEVNGKSVVDAYGFKVMLGTQLRDLQDGKPGEYSIGFMYDGDGYNNEVVGNAKLVVKEAKKPSQKPEEKPANPAGTTNPTSPAADSSNNGGNDDAGANANKNVKPATASSGKAEKALPQTSDSSPIVPDALVAAGAAACALGIAAKRIRGNR